MRAFNRLIRGFLVLACAGGAAPAPAAQPDRANPAPGRPAGAAGAALSPDATVDQILDALEARGKDLKEFDANVRLQEMDDTGGVNVRTGRVWFQGPSDSGRIRVLFERREGNKKIYAEKIEYLLADGWLVERDYGRRNEVRRQVLRPGEKINLLKLGEGPFPLPIGQDKGEVHKSFDVEKVEAADGDPAGTVHLRLAPKPGTQFEKKFEAIDAWVDLKSRMPTRIEVTDANAATTRTTDLTNLRVNPNPPLTKGDFTLARIDEAQWDVHVERVKE